MLRILYRLLRHILVQYSWSGSQFNNPSVQKHSHTLIVWEVWCCMLHNYVYMFFQVHATTFFCCNAALRTTRGSLYVCLYVSFSFFVIYSKNLQATHTSKFVIICNIFLRMQYLYKYIYIYIGGLMEYISKKVAAYGQFVLVNSSGSSMH